jgi:hypothetical protein
MNSIKYTAIENRLLQKKIASAKSEINSAMLYITKEISVERSYILSRKQLVLIELAVFRCSEDN